MFLASNLTFLQTHDRLLEIAHVRRGGGGRGGGRGGEGEGNAAVKIEMEKKGAPTGPQAILPQGAQKNFSEKTIAATGKVTPNRLYPQKRLPALAKLLQTGSTHTRKFFSSALFSDPRPTPPLVCWRVSDGGTGEGKERKGGRGKEKNGFQGWMSGAPILDLGLGYGILKVHIRKKVGGGNGYRYTFGFFFWKLGMGGWISSEGSCLLGWIVRSWIWDWRGIVGDEGRNGGGEGTGGGMRGIYRKTKG